MNWIRIQTRICRGGEICISEKVPVSHHTLDAETAPPPSATMKESICRWRGLCRGCMAPGPQLSGLGSSTLLTSWDLSLYCSELRFLLTKCKRIMTISTNRAPVPHGQQGRINVSKLYSGYYRKKTQVFVKLSSWEAHALEASWKSDMSVMSHGQ